MAEVNWDDFWNLVRDGRFFRVGFVKRTNGEYRRMLARVGVKRHLRGGQAAYDAREKNLLHVWDVQKKGYRSINLDDVRELKVHGVFVQLGDIPA